MDKLPSYSRVYNLGHRALRDFFDGHAIEVTEKVDGSQFSFAMIDGELHFRSKGAVILKDAPGMFEAGVRSICERASGLTEGWIYRGEYLSKPKHNALAYDSIPKGHVILFGIDLTMGGQDYVSHNFLAAEARRLDLEVVPLLGYVHQPDMEWLNETLETESVLGGQKIEGIVMKNYRRFDQDGKVLMAKFVSEK
ncbi:MAG TPA: RNA ligase family protein, partial [Candidatus Krumholzibacterium sp.]|nr:RNA ligase family protein [Candidatus Krumholzibacterium sp.]